MINTTNLSVKARQVHWHVTAKIDGKTVNKRLGECEARLYQEWIGNERAVCSVLAEMREVAAKAQAIVLAEQGTDRPGPGPRRPSPETRQGFGRRRS